MKCPSCGGVAPDTAVRCAQCQTPLSISSRVTAGSTALTADPAETVFGSATMPPDDAAETIFTAHAPIASRPMRLLGPLEIGQQFGTRYHIIRQLGVGGMGAVYQAWDAELGVAVALKVIRPEVTRDPASAQDIERRFKQELLLARQVTHKNVVRIHDLGEISGIKYITMPYIQGADLATRLRDGRLPIAKILPLARQIAVGLQAAHEAGVVHRDLKPANVMIESDDHAVIMDFGIARSTSRVGAMPVSAGATGLDALSAAAHDELTRIASTVVGEVIGTIEYMAPEQATGSATDHRADIYAFGLILHDMLTGRRRADHAVSAVAELKQRLAHPPPSLRATVPGVPSPLDQLVTRCTEPDPAKRFQTTADLVAALERLDDNGRLRPVKRTVRLPLAVAVASVLLALSGFVWWSTRPPVTHDPVSVVIADFANTTGDRTFDNALNQTLRRALEDASFISAFDRSRIRSTLGMQVPDTLDQPTARALALKQGLGVVLSGSIDREGSGYQVSVQAAHTVTGTVIASVGGFASDRDSVLETATRLVARVRNALGDETSESAQLFAMRSLSTSSLDVVSHYAAAVEAQTRGRFEDARQSYQQAVKLDPKFGLGYQGLAVMSRNLNQPEDAERYIKEAFRYLDGMTEREKFATRGFYYRMIGDNQQCAKEYSDSLSRYPADTVARNQRAGCLAKLRQMREAVTEMQQASAMLPNHAGYRMNLALLATLAGDFDSAAGEVLKLPQDARSLQILAYTQLGRGLVREAGQTYETISTMGAAGASSAALGLGDLAVYEGRFADAIRILEHGIESDLAAKNLERAAFKMTSLANAYLLAGRHEAAIAAAERAQQFSKGLPVRFMAARVLVEAGAVPKARALAASLSSEIPAEPQAHGKIIEGQIALKSGQAREAITILTDANRLLDTWLGRFELGRAYLAAGALPQADSEFDRCIARRGEVLSLMDEGPTFGHFPSVYYYQGRVREALKTAAFADSYRKYLEIRGGSTEDPLLPAVRKATSSP
jgi:serine/threonine protein kinase/tetratricopeptide (TPR) repeat protein